MFADEKFILFISWIISTHGIICFSKKLPPSSFLACREWFLCFHSLKPGVLRGPAFPSPGLTLLCWWLTVEQLCDLRSSESAGCVACCWAADVTACLGSNLLSEAAANKSISLDIITFALGNGSFFSMFLCVFSFLQITKERKHLSINYQKRNFLTI